MSLHAGDEGHGWLLWLRSPAETIAVASATALSQSQADCAGAGAGFDIKHKRVGILRNLLAHDAAALQGNGAHGAGNIAQSVDFFVSLKKYRVEL